MSRASVVLVGSVVLFFAAEPLWRAAAAEDGGKDSLSKQESEETSQLILAELPNWKLWSGADREHELMLHPKSVLIRPLPDRMIVCLAVIVQRAGCFPATINLGYNRWHERWPMRRNGSRIRSASWRHESRLESVP